MAFDFGKMANTVTSKVSKFGQEASSMTKNVAENVRINSAISEQKKIVQAMYSVIGKKYFEQFGKNPEAEFQAEIGNINAALEKIADLERQLSEVKGTCPSCGAKVTPGAAFCVSCGAKLSKETVQTPAPQGTANADETAQTAAADAGETAQAAAVNTEDAAQAAAADAEDAAQAAAANSGETAQAATANATDAQWQTSATDTVSNAEKVQSADTQSDQWQTSGSSFTSETITGKVCPACKAVMGENMSFCTKCGTKLD